MEERMTSQTPDDIEGPRQTASGVLLAPILAHFTLNFFGIAALRKRRGEG